MNLRTSIKTVKRIVVKVGTSSLILPNGRINLKTIDQLAFTLSDLATQEYEIILVSSGAIGAGMVHLNLKYRPESIAEQQALAAIGQLELMNLYNQRFKVYYQKSAQVLLTRDVIDFPESRRNVYNTFHELLKMGIIPIVNENDSVAVDELNHQTVFGDNDQLSAIVANLVQADLLVILSDIDGFYSDNPRTNKDAKIFHHIPEITADLFECSGGKGSELGTGGMITKLKAAELILKNNGKVILANGKKPSILFDILDGKEIGTLFGK